MVHYKKHDKHKKLSKKNILLGTMATILCSIPISIGITEITKNVRNVSSSLSNSLSNMNNNVVKQTLENDGATWKVTLNNGEIKTFNSPEQMRKELLKNSNIKEEIYTSDVDLNSLTNKNTGVLNIQNNPNVVKGNISNSKKTIYKGKKSEIFLSENEAKESYFNANEAYNFNDLYFKDKNDLRDYLENEYLKNTENTKINSIVLEGPNGVKSNSINLNSKYAISIIDSFIEANAKKVFSYKNSTTNETINFTKDNADSVLNSISTKDVELSHIQSNQGESRYVVDNHVNDDYDLIGPYFYKGNLDVGAFMNKNMWKKVNGVHKQVYQESQVDKVIGSFFSSIINDDNGTNLKEISETSNNTSFFRTPLIVENKPIDDWFLDEIGKFNNSFKESIVSANTRLMQGKKYNTFYKIPVLYNFILQRLFDLNAPQTLLNNAIFYFKKICEFIQGAIETIILDKSLLVGVDGKYFNMIELFQIGNLEFDTNTSTQYFLGKLKSNFPLLVGAMSSYMGAVNNIYLFATLLPFSSYDQKYLVDFGIMSQSQLNENKTKYFNIYDTFSQINFNNLVSKFAKYSTSYSLGSNEQDSSKIISTMEKINLEKMDNLSLKDYLNSIGTKNALPYQLHNLAIRDELLQYANGKALRKDSYLSNYKWNGKWEHTAFAQHMIDAFAIKAKQNEHNPDYDFYKTYLSLLIDSRMNENPWDRVFGSTAVINSDYELVKGITRLVGLSLATASLATESIRKIYNATKNIGTIGSSLSRAIKNRWTSFKNLFPSTMRTWNVNASTSFSIKKWSMSNVFSKIGQGIDVLKGAAPIIGTAFLGFEVFVLVFELLKTETTTNFYVYTAADGTEFIWNGGRTVSKYFGFDVQETNGISSMKLVEPIQITLPQVEEYYYFNGIKYYDPNQAKKGYIEYLLNNGDISTNKNFSIKYTFENEKDFSKGESFDSLDKLKDKVFESLNIDRKNSNIDLNKINLNSKYISNVSYKYGNISTFDPSSFNEIQKNQFVGNIINNIRETYFSKLPQYLDKDPLIVIPGKVWKNGKIIEDNTTKIGEYVINNSANEVDKNDNYVNPNNNEAKEKSRLELKKSFIEKSNIENKQIFYTNNPSFVLSKKFDSISSNIKEYKVYTVTKQGMGQYQFLDKAKAENFAMNYRKIEKQYTTSTKYIYNGIVFSSEKDLQDWLIANGKY